MTVSRGTSGVCVEVPVVLAGLVAAWSAALMLLVWWTDHGPMGAAVWGLFTTGVAMVWTLGYLVGRQSELLRAAYECGREERSSLASVERL